MRALRINVDGSVIVFDVPEKPEGPDQIDVVCRALGAVRFETHTLPGPMVLWTDLDIELGHRDAAINYPATVALRRFGANTGHLRGPVALTGGIDANGQVGELADEVSTAVEDFLDGDGAAPLPD